MLIWSWEKELGNGGGKGPLLKLLHFLIYSSQQSWTSLVAQTVKHLSTMQETWVRSLGREDPLEKGMATQSSILAWRIPWTEEPGRSPRVRHNWVTNTSAPRFPRLFGLSYLTSCNSLLRFRPLSPYPQTLQLLLASGSPAHSTMANFTSYKHPWKIV